jgi:hypothetical protein
MPPGHNISPNAATLRVGPPARIPVSFHFYTGHSYWRDFATVNRPMRLFPERRWERIELKERA